MASNRKPKLLNRQQLAIEMGVTAGTITRWQRDGMPTAKKMPRGRASLFDLKVVQAWREQTDSANGASADGISLERERALLARVQREKAEIEVARLRSELVPYEAVAKAGEAQVIAWRNVVLKLARRLVLAGRIPKDLEASVKEGCRDLLTTISEWRDFDDVESAETDA